MKIRKKKFIERKMKDNEVRTCRWPLYQQDQLGFPAFPSLLPSFLFPTQNPYPVTCSATSPLHCVSSEDGVTIHPTGMATVKSIAMCLVQLLFQGVGPPTLYALLWMLSKSGGKCSK